MRFTQATRRSVLAALASVPPLGLAGCSQTGDETGGASGTTTADSRTATAAGATESPTRTATDTPTATETNLPDGVSYPEPDKPATEIILLETSDNFEVVLNEATQNGKYIGKTMRVPRTKFLGKFGTYIIFVAYYDEDTRSPQEGFAIPVDDVEQDYFEGDGETEYKLEGRLAETRVFSGDYHLVLSGDNVTLTEL